MQTPLAIPYPGDDVQWLSWHLGIPPPGKLFGRSVSMSDQGEGGASTPPLFVIDVNSFLGVGGECNYQQSQNLMKLPNSCFGERIDNSPIFVFGELLNSIPTSSPFSRG